MKLCKYGHVFNVSNAKIFSIMEEFLDEKFIHDHVLIAFSKYGPFRNKVALHIFTDHPGAIIGLHGQLILNLNLKLRSHTRLNKVVLHDCDRDEKYEI